MSLFRRFASNNSGGVAVTFAVALVPVLGSVGVAVDYAHVAAVQSKLADALDAGVLAVGSGPALSDKEAYKKIEDWMGAQMGPGYDGQWQLDFVAQDGNGKVAATASAKVKTTIASIIGVDEVAIDVTSEALQTVGKVEVALVLDNTGSMKGTKLSKLKDAATSLVDSLEKVTKDPKDLRIGLVPFSQTVNVGAKYADESWIDKAGKSDAAKSLFLGQTVNRLELFEKLGTKWGGCVETRAADYEAEETAPDSGTPDTLYVPYFAPDEPGKKGQHGNGKYNNSYLDDRPLADILKTLGLSKTELADFMYLQGDVVKYDGGKPYSGTTDTLGYQYGPNSGCEIAPLLRLASDAAKVRNAIDAMVARGNTDVPIGLTWGWNLVSPTGPFGDGAEYDDKEWRKFVVLMTDGNNENEVGNVDDKSFYSGIGYTWQGRMGVSANASKSQRTAARDERLAEICANMKAEGIVIYTLRVEVKTGSSKVLENCASSDDMFYEVENVAQLDEAFQSIGDSIQTLRLAR